MTSKTRKALADHLKAPDTTGSIPEGRWMRAMQFERLVHSDKFVSELVTKTLGQLGLPRPKAVTRSDCGGNVGATAKALKDAHLKANFSDTVTMINALGVPYLRLEGVAGATAIQPDFAIVAPRSDGSRMVGSWLIMGDAKDYERVRSRIDDGRMLKGFLQVALGAESAAAWSKVPRGMQVHLYGALAVPRNAFLQPEAVVERLDDHRLEVRLRAEERLAEKEKLGEDRPAETELAAYVTHLEATFDPRTCSTCNLFNFCRKELRAMEPDPVALLTEIGVDRLTRPALVGLVSGTGEVGEAIPDTTRAQVLATVTGLPQWTDRLRVDPAGLPGTINLVLVKADSAALGVHGIAVQRIGSAGPSAWALAAFADPQSPITRRRLMQLIGAAIQKNLDEMVGPTQLVVPDRPTADLLATAADSLAGVELSRLRWQRDLDSGRKALTFDGEPATVPEPLAAEERLAVSFLLEEDRARAMSVRSPIVILRDVLAAHLVAGGPASDSGRLDYLVEWAKATSPLMHRVLSDDISSRLETPGARLSNLASNEIHTARRNGEPGEYDALVKAALSYRTTVLDEAIAALGALSVSRLRDVHRILESDAQMVWGRRLALQASDLVRFSRTWERWRNSHVDMLDADRKCFGQLATLADASIARDRALDASVRELAIAKVVGLNPVRLQVRSRRLTAGTHVAALHVNERSLIEAAGTTLKIQQGSFKFGQLPVAPLTEIKDTKDFGWSPRIPVVLSEGDLLVLADATWLGGPFRTGHEIAVKRPGIDKMSAPGPDCLPGSFGADPEGHNWCCKPHVVREGETSDLLAARRAKGELNPQTWPPLVDEERFDVGPGDDAPDVGTLVVPTDLTVDDLGE